MTANERSGHNSRHSGFFQVIGMLRFGGIIGRRLGAKAGLRAQLLFLGRGPVFVALLRREPVAPRGGLIGPFRLPLGEVFFRFQAGTGDAPDRRRCRQEILRALVECKAPRYAMFRGLDKVVRRARDLPQTGLVSRRRNYPKGVSARAERSRQDPAVVG